MRKAILFLSAVLCVITLVSCSKKTPQDGLVEFSVEGKKYRIENREFTIRVNPVLWEGEKVKVIPKGSKNLFEFKIGPTEDASFAFNILIPGRSIKNPQERTHDCWIEIDETTEGRIRGHFGGSFVMNLLGKEADEKFAMHQRGKIDKETLMNEIEKKIQ